MQKYKKGDDRSYALGTELTLELLLRHPESVVNVYIHSKQKDNEIYRRIVDICNKKRIEIVKSDKAFNILSDKENCYVIGVFRKFTNPIRADKKHVVLVNPGNTGNLGTIIRTAVGFGINDIAIIAPGVDIYDPKTIRASMGAFFEVHFSYFESFEKYRQFSSKREVFPFMLDGAVTLENVSVPEIYSIIFGNEATGLPAQYSSYGQSVYIQIMNTVDSLNLCNAVSIGLYYFTKGKVGIDYLP